MSYTQTDLAAAEAALRQAMKGKSVSYADRSWTSQDLPALRELVAEIRRAVNATPTTRYAAHSKGLSC